MEEQIKMPDLSNATSEEIAKQVVKILGERKSHGLQLLHVENQTVLTDYFVLCSGNSNTQVRSLASEVEYKMGQCNVKVWNMDGYSTGEWVVVDLGCVMVHVFQHGTRDFYKLEKLWAESEEVDISDILTDD